MTDMIDAYGIQLRPIAEEHLEPLRKWRNSPEVAHQMVTQKLITVTQQVQWFHSIRERKDQQHFAILYRQQLIGAANLKTLNGGHIVDADTLEPGIYIGAERYRANVLAFAPSLTLLDYCFDGLKVKQLTARVKVSNQAALSYNYKLGYVAVDKDERFVQIALKAQPYHDATTQLKSLFNRNRRK